MRRYKKPYKIRKKKSIFKNYFFWKTILILAASCGLFYLLIFSSFFQIKEIKISGNQKVLSQDIYNIIQNKIKQRILFFASESIFLTNLTKINSQLLEKFPQIAQINLKRKFPDILIIEIKERETVAIFYQNENYFFIDKEGIIFKKIFEIKPEMLKIKSLIQEKTLNLGQEAIDNKLMAEILEIKNELENLEIFPKKVSLISDQRLNIETSNNWQIYFNPKNNIPQQIFNLKAILGKKIPPEKWPDLKYIDLRFEEKIFYKFF